MLNRLHTHPDQTQPDGSMQGWAASYDRITALMFLGSEAKLRQAALDLAGLKPGESVIEAGCGTGTLTLAAKQRVGPQGQVAGLDVAPDMLAAARLKATKAGQHIDFRQGRIEQIPFPDGSFDLGLASFMIHHIPDQKNKQQGLNELFRVLKPSGRLFIVDFEPPSNPVLRHLALGLMGDTMVAHTASELAPMFEKAGFTRIESGRVKSQFLSYVRGFKP